MTFSLKCTYGNGVETHLMFCIRIMSSPAINAIKKRIMVNSERASCPTQPSPSPHKYLLINPYIFLLHNERISPHAFNRVIMVEIPTMLKGEFPLVYVALIYAGIETRPDVEQRCQLTIENHENLQTKRINSLA